MNTPLIILCGAAGSGKDSVANFIAKNRRAAFIAQADPMKRLAAWVFNFTEEQLWGPSECRNAPDLRYNKTIAWNRAKDLLDGWNIQIKWIEEVLPNFSDEQRSQAFSRLVEWFEDCRRAHVGTDRDQFGDHPLTPRWVLQSLGTEFGRKICPNMWSELAINSAFKLLDGTYTGYDRISGLNRLEGSPPEYVAITDGRFRNEVLNTRRAGGFALHVVDPNEKGLAAGIAGHRSEAELKEIPDHFYNAILVNNKSLGLKNLESKVSSLINYIEIQLGGRELRG